jgi:hypothetical protein
MLIAFTARRHGETVVTGDYSAFDFLRCELRISVFQLDGNSSAAKGS